MSSRASGTATAGMAVAVVLAWLNGLLVRTVSLDVQFFGLTAWWSSRAVDDTVVLTKSAWDGVRDVFLFPGSWPLLVVLVVAVVVALRGRSSPAPPRPPDP